MIGPLGLTFVETAGWIRNWPSNGNRRSVAARQPLTSGGAKHIYEAARRRLGSQRSNLTQFADAWQSLPPNCAYLQKLGGRVYELTSEEKAQILYNHVNFGEQSQSWKSSVKPHLAAVATVRDFFLGSLNVSGSKTSPRALALAKALFVRFMEEPTEHLIDTINALDGRLQTTLLLVYVHQAGFDPIDHDVSAAPGCRRADGVHSN